MWAPRKLHKRDEKNRRELRIEDYMSRSEIIAY